MVLALLSARRFLPLFVTQFLGALNDNLYKNAMVVLLLWRAGEAGPTLVAAAGGVFILPYALFSALAGELADRSDMARLIRWIKLFEIGLMTLGGLGLATGNPWLLMAVLFGLGVHSTFFGPMKYAILPIQLAPAELVTGNGLVEAGTFVAILLGTLAGGGLALAGEGGWVVTATGLAAALGGYLAAHAIPRVAPGAPGLPLAWNPWQGTREILGLARANRPVWHAILALSWFWTIGATVLSQFPVMAKDALGAGSSVVTAFLAVFSVGVGIGSLLEARLLAGQNSLRHVPWAALGLSVLLADFVAACHGATFADAATLFAAPAGWRVLGDLLALAICGGVFSLPLYARMQEMSAPAMRARIIAANNVMNAAFMVAGAAVAAGLSAASAGAPRILLLTALLNLGAFVLLLRAARGEAAAEARHASGRQGR